MVEEQTSQHEGELLCELLESNDAYCPHCGYNLRGSRSLKCSECGRTFSFQSIVKRNTQRFVPYLITLCLLASVLPQSFINWQRLLIRGKVHYGYAWYNNSWQVPPLSVWQTMVMWASHCFWFGMPVWIMLLIVFRKKYLQLPRWLQWGISILVAIAIFVAYRRYQFWYYNFNLNGNHWPPGDLWYLMP